VVEGTERRKDNQHWTSHDWATFVVEVIGIAVVVVTVYFLLRQTQEMVDQTQVMVDQTEQMTTQTEQLFRSLDRSTSQNIFQSTLEWDKLRVEQSTVLAQLEKSARELAATGAGRDKLKAIQMAFYQLDFFDYIVEQFELIEGGTQTLDPAPKDQPGSSWQAWSRVIEDTLRDSPLMCEVLAENKAKYSSKFIQQIKDLRVCKDL
jgi:hypothetical protein